MKTILLSLILPSIIHAIPIIHSIEPHCGSSQGNEAITIKGEGFLGIHSVHFGSVDIPTETANDKELTLLTPSHVPQVVPVSVENQEGRSNVHESSLFVFQGAPLCCIASQGNHEIMLFQSGELLSKIEVDSIPFGLFISYDGNKLLVPNLNGSSFSLVDLNTRSTEIIGTGSKPSAAAFTPDGRRAILTCDDSSIVSVFDVETKSIERVQVQNMPTAVAITPDGTKAIVTNKMSDSVSIIHLNDSYTVNHIPVGKNPLTLTITPDGRKALILNHSDSSVSLLDLEIEKVTHNFTVGTAPCSIAITPDGLKAVVTNFVSNTISILDLESLNVVQNISVGTSPIAVAIVPNKLQALVLNYASSSLSIIDLDNNTLSETVNIGTNPIAIALSADGSQAYVTNDGPAKLSIIDIKTKTILSQQSISHLPDSLLFTPDQAPLARFVATTSFLGEISYFDASTSCSPSGAISSYHWDFGDGQSAISTESMVSHLYTVPGTYQVSLRVVNSAGTSTEQHYLPMASRLYSNHSNMINQNGSQVALTRHNIRIDQKPEPIIVEPTPKPSFKLYPPTSFIVKKVIRNRHGYYTIINTLTWQPVTVGVAPQFYCIYRNSGLTDFVAKIPAAGPLLFEDPCEKREVKSYYIVSIDGQGNRSRAFKVCL